MLQFHQTPHQKEVAPTSPKPPVFFKFVTWRMIFSP